MATFRPVRAEVMEFATILERPSGSETGPKAVNEDTLWLRIKARVLTEDGETVDYLGDPMPFHLVPKKEP